MNLENLIASLVVTFFLAVMVMSFVGFIAGPDEEESETVEETVAYYD